MSANKENINAPNTANVKEKAENNGLPYVRIVEQPRILNYTSDQCENRTTRIEGQHSKPLTKSYPAIEIVNSEHPAFAVVSCVTKDWPHRPHPHRILGNGSQFLRGVCLRAVPAGQRVLQFPSMSIEWVGENRVESSLEERKRVLVDPFVSCYPECGGAFDLDCVRLCFQVFLASDREGDTPVPLKPIVSEPVYREANVFQIRWMSDTSATVAGGKVICILCDKVDKNDIEVVFFCESSGWQATAEFSDPVCHEQVALVVKTPMYFDQELIEAVQVKVMLRQPSTGVTSTPMSFDYLPEITRSSIKVKKPVNKSIQLSKSPRAPLVHRALKKNHRTPLDLRIKLKRVLGNRVPQALLSEMLNEQCIKMKTKGRRKEFSNPNVCVKNTN